MTKYLKPNSRILDAAEAKAKQDAKRAAEKSARAFRPITNRHGGAYQTNVDPGVVFQGELGELKEGNEGFAWTCCPFHDDHNPSFCVNLESGWYKCHSTSCEETGSNIVGFVSALHGFNFAEAREYLETQYG